MQTVEEFLTHYRRQRGWTLKLVRAVPEDRFDWAPQADAFSCGALVRHLIQAESFWRKLMMSAVRGEAFDPFGFEGSAEERLIALRPQNLRSAASSKLGSSFGELLAAWAQVQAHTEAELGTLTPSQLREVIVEHPLARLRLPIWEMLLVFVEHEAHHRGQLSAYLKVLGVPQPPVFGVD